MLERVYKKPIRDLAQMKLAEVWAEFEQTIVDRPAKERPRACVKAKEEELRRDWLQQFFFMTI